jgi:hypothetical protein
MESKTRINSITASIYGVSGSIAAAFIACSISIISIGILTAIRHTFPFNEWLVPTSLLSQYGGIFLYSHLIWIASWILLYSQLKKRITFGQIRHWMIIFIGSVLSTTLIMMYVLDWMKIFILFIPR